MIVVERENINSEKQTGRPAGYWNNPENLRREVEHFVEKHGADALPTEEKLKEAYQVFIKKVLEGKDE